MYFLYSLLLAVWGVLLLPFFLYRSWRRGRRLEGLAERFGRLPASLGPSDGGAVWFHSCSVGETLSLEPLVEALRARLPRARFLFSTVTPTGRQVAVDRFGAANVFYFPVDFAFVVRRVLERVRPSVIVIIDTEIWPNLLARARERGIPVVLVNGRISPASFPWYRRARPLLRHVLRNYEALLMQSGEDAGRILAMGAPRDRVRVTGNLKFDREAGGAPPAVSSDLREGFLAGPGPLIVAGSTHPGEEAQLLETLRRLRATPGCAGVRLLLAPRHPERFDEAARLAEDLGFSVRRRSRPEPGGAEVLLLDTLGELAAVYRHADVVFVGGTLVRRGGHSILEPAAFRRAIVVGPSMENFQSIADVFLAGGALCRIAAGEEDPELQRRQLLDVFLHLLQNAGERERMGAAAGAILERNRGAARSAAEAVAALFDHRARA
ncbi:MAG: 3-deoxy-D-manno-octulosonic acid transferase [Acidobacteria bacterium]|nr:3-deoxy-D-manno-octulosonic acid transferase [Acidobacteriota bacterium]